MTIRLIGAELTPGHPYNNFWDHRDVTYESGVVTEPVALQELKDRLRLEGFTDDDESPAESLSDFDFDNNLLQDCIKAARELIEQVCGLSLVPKTLEGMITNLLGGQEIKYGPVNTVTRLEDSNGTEILSTAYGLSGIQWKRLMYPRGKDMKITYMAGYTTVPAPIKMDIMKAAVFIYTNPGDDEGAKKLVLNLSRRYSRNTWLA